MSTALVWFRRDLRLADNPALCQAVRNHDRIVPVFIYAPHEEAPWQPGAASRWWLHHSLEALAASLDTLGSRLIVRAGDSLSTLEQLVSGVSADAVYWNRLYDPALIVRDKHIKGRLQSQGLHAWSGNAGLLCEPWTVATGAGKPYRVFTPFWRTCRTRLSESAIESSPPRLPAVDRGIGSELPKDLGLLPQNPWDGGLRATWTPGETGALERSELFLSAGIGDYTFGRDFPARFSTSRLSPHLHFGEIGPRQLVSVALSVAGRDLAREKEVEKFLSELGWREFAHHLLFHFPETIAKPLNEKFTLFPWRGDWKADFERWCGGNTGIPIVDAGMRELWSQGWMHNRMRMVVGSLLTKNLRIPWLSGARWFWDTLVDADLASNTLGWQWVSGCGADAAPYYRIFNPVRQAEKFDAEGEYVRRWVPELRALPDRYLNVPWEAPASVLTNAGVCLGDTYPDPIVDLKASRRVALDGYAQIMGRA